MKKIVKVALIVIGAVIVLGIVAGIAGGNKSNTPSSNPQTVVAAASEQPTFTISNSRYIETSVYEKGVVCEITNNGSTVHSAALKATFYNDAGEIVGTAITAVNDIAPNETKTANLYTNDDVSTYKTFKVQVDSSY